MLSDNGAPAVQVTHHDRRRPGHRRKLAATLMSLTAMNLAAAPAGAAAVHSGSPVVSLADFSVVGSSTLVRTDHGVSANGSYEHPGDVVTLWWAVFNAPAECEAGIPGLSMCGPQDHLAGRGQVSLVLPPDVSSAAKERPGTGPTCGWATPRRPWKDQDCSTPAAPR